MLVGMHTYQHINNAMIYCAAWGYPAGQYTLYNEIRSWCNRSFGDPAPDGFTYEEWFNSDYKWRDYVVWGEIEFKNEKTLHWFLLKWQ